MTGARKAVKEAKAKGATNTEQAVKTAANMTEDETGSYAMYQNPWKTPLDRVPQWTYCNNQHINIFA